MTPAIIYRKAVLSFSLAVLAIITLMGPAGANTQPARATAFDTIANRPLIIHVTSAPVAGRFARWQNSPHGIPYLGTVTTMGGIFAGVGAIEYAPDLRQFFVAETGPWGTSIARVAPNGTSTTIANLFGNVYGIAYDSSTRLLYVGLTESCAIVSVNPKNGTENPLAGGVSCGTADGQGSAAQFQHPAGIAVDPAGQILYVTDGDRVREVTTSGLVSTITPPGSLGGGGQCNSGYQGIAFDRADGNLYIADACPNLIRRVTIATGEVSTLAGQCIGDVFGDCQPFERDGMGLRALFAQPSAIAYSDDDHRLYVADGGNEQIRAVTSSGLVTTLAGSGHADFIDGIGNGAAFNTPTGLTVLSNELIYVADANNGVIRKVVGNGPAPPPPQHGITFFDPPTIGAAPYGLALAPDGGIWYSEFTAGKLARIDSTGKTHEYKLPKGNFPLDLAIDAAGDIWFSDAQGSPPYFLTYYMGVRTPTGGVTLYPIPNNNAIDDITLGSDQNIWFDMPASGALANITSSGLVTEYAVDAPADVGSGFNNDIWTTGQGFVEEFSTAGVLLKKYSYAVSGGVIVRGPLNRMWFGQPQAIGEVLRNTLALYSLPPAPTQLGAWNPMGLATAADGSVWFTANAAGYVCNLKVNGLFTPVVVPAPRSAPLRMVVGGDGSIWFTDPGAAKIGRWF